MVNNKLAITEEDIWKCLETIPDPDLPAISITELGIVRSVKYDGKVAIVTITPTYSGCPAWYVFQEDILSQLKVLGCEEVHLHTSLTPPWTTDWLSEETKMKMKKYGIAPPEKSHSGETPLFADANQVIACPFCDSTHTHRTSQFGSTACKALWYCDSCQQPFDYFKCYGS